MNIGPDKILILKIGDNTFTFNGNIEIIIKDIDYDQFKENSYEYTNQFDYNSDDSYDQIIDNYNQNEQNVYKPNNENIYDQFMRNTVNIQTYDDKILNIWASGSCSNNHASNNKRTMGVGIVFSERYLPNLSFTIKIGDRTNTRAQMIAIQQALHTINDRILVRRNINLYSSCKTVIDGINIPSNSKNRNRDIWVNIRKEIGITIHNINFIYEKKGSSKGIVSAENMSRDASI